MEYKGADFVTVMGIAKRYRLWWERCDCGNPPDWYNCVFLTSMAAQNSQRWQTAQRNLLAWDAEHTDTTEQKEDKTVIETQSKRTMVHELLGVEPLQEFYVKGKGLILYRVALSSCLEFKGITGTWALENQCALVELVCDPSLIIRRPTLTDEQREVLVALWKLGYAWITIGTAGLPVAWKSKPEIINMTWKAECQQLHGSGLSIIAKITHDCKEPLDIEKTLKEAGAL